ncbi:MAG: transglycosylase SLT domain-containing protein [Myxococcales bacterium]|nr:transglycosylase SLT domain-containing protein [Myxococcales bacterium]
MRRLGSFASLALVFAACARGSGPPPSPSASAPPAPSAAPPDAEASAAVPDISPSEWAEAIRLGRFADAAKLIDALGAGRDRPEVRFARARVARALGDDKEAARLLDGLERQLGVLADEIADDRAEAQAKVGPFEPAARHFEAKKTASALTRAALAWERAGKLDEARRAADRAVGLATAGNKAKQKKNGPSRVEIEARHARALIAEKQGAADIASAELRWLATFAPAAEFASDVDARLEKLAPKRALSKRERYERALAMARAGKVELVERELSAIDKADGPGVTKAEALHAKGWALYQARDFLRAAEVLTEASRLGGEHAAHDLFHAARALSRAHKDDKAIAVYGEVARRFKASPYAEQGRFLSARLLYVGGRWKEAANAYTAYTKRHAKEGRFSGQVHYEQAVAWLASGQYEKAAKTLAKLAEIETNDHERASIQELTGVALEGAGKKPAAARVYQKVVEERPLSFAALAASTRLAKLGHPAPPPIEPPKLGPVRGELAVELPAKARLLHSLGFDTDAEQVLERQEEDIRRKYAPRGDEALCRMYGELGPAARRYRVGQRAARPTDLARAPAPDTRWVWDCIYPRPYEELVRSAEKQWGLPNDLLYAVMRQESAFSPTVVSPANAVGLLQLIPPTAQNAAKELELTFEPLLLSNPAYNIRLGSFYLSKVLGTFGGNVALGAAAYNAGPSAVSRWLETGEKLPLDVFVARIPYDETRVYVGRVVGNLARYAYLAGGDEAVPRLALEIPTGLRAGEAAY